MDTVTSELYDEFDYKSLSSPTVDKNGAVSLFKFQYHPNPKPVEVDEDGDLVVCRRTNCEEWGVIEIEHSKSTGLDLVGLQIWRGALLLADWILYNGSTFSPDSYLLELGAGVGFTSIVAAIYAPVCCTDINRGDIFKLIESNCKRNNKITKYPIKIMEIDFMAKKMSSEVEEMLLNVSTVLAADVIYDNELTDYFIQTIERILTKPPKKTIYVAIEKRFVFTLADCDTVAPCYDYFIDSLNSSKTIKFEVVPIDFPQYFQYDRTRHLRILKLTYK